MSTEESAALAESETIDDGIDTTVEEVTQEATQTDSAPVEESPLEETVKDDGFQKRINKVTADKYAEKRRADELQKKLDDMSQAKTVAAKAPTLEDHDFDEAAFNEANIEYKVQKAIDDRDARQKESSAQAKAQQMKGEFNERIIALDKPDFDEVANAIPMLPDGVADALMQSENGAELIYHLGTHLDQSDKLANMTPAAAMMELGRLSVSMNETPKPKLSAAPDPIEPLSSGGSISQERGPKGATFT